MKLLIDACVDARLRLQFPGRECQTVRFANLAGLTNGRLLEAFEAAGFDVLITVTKHSDQQDLSQRSIAIVILCGRTNRLRDIELLAPVAITAVGSICRSRGNQ
jgi:predicted nuclease of predicted toxin-antitoxin system